jgi:hypothetical protein
MGCPETTTRIVITECTALGFPKAPTPEKVGP